MDLPIFTLAGGAPGRAALRAAVLDALADGHKKVAVRLDGLRSLESETIRGLIELLRRVRERGAELDLHASRPDILRTLHVTALDKIFNVCAGGPAVAA